MSIGLEVTVEWEALDRGSREEAACFGAFGIALNGIWLTEYLDALSESVRRKPFLSGYHFAEWAAWNWWRLRWEPRSKSNEWALSHKMATIGSGYVWPDIEVFSDGLRTYLVSHAHPSRPDNTHRYLVDFVGAISAAEFEVSLVAFFEKISARLDAKSVKGTNLQNILDSLFKDRNDPAIASRRKLEALLGFDPGEADDGILATLEKDAKEYGANAIDEIAAGQAASSATLGVKELKAFASIAGDRQNVSDIVVLNDRITLPNPVDIPAWMLGAKLASSLRHQERLAERPIPDKQLADMFGISPSIIDKSGDKKTLAYAIELSAHDRRVVLRSNYKANRRFEVARLLGDALMASEADKLFLATASGTYRQKMQRAFAAEFLSPHDAVCDRLKGDFSDDSLSSVAEHFAVSDRTIRTLLVNHGHLERNSLEREDAA